jgi:hypothetical protein
MPVFRKRPPLTVEQVLAWADAHRERTGRWPNQNSGPVADAPEETWCAIDHALRRGLRGFPGADSLDRLLGRHRRGGERSRQPAWTPEEDELVRALAPRRAAARTGRSLRAVYMRRHALGERGG